MFNNVCSPQLIFAVQCKGSPKEHMVATVKVYDRADEFRIEIAGRFAGDRVGDIAQTWKNALLETGPRRFIVDISRLTAYDAAGRQLLEEMYRHGTQIAAGTPLSLVFLSEISAPPRRGPTPITDTRRRDMPAAVLRPIAAGQ